MGGSGLGSNFLPINYMTYSDYVAGLTANQLVSGDLVQKSALTALSTYDATQYGNGYVTVTGALGLALGVSASDLSGFTSSGAECLGLGSGSVSDGTYCYDDVIYVTDPNTENGQQLWWRQQGQPGDSPPANAYDFYSVVEHETDEALGTASCIDTQDGHLSNWCGPNNNGIVNGHANTPSAADLFRYSSAGHLVLDSSFSTKAGAYFSYDGGVTNGLSGAVYNTTANGADYGDFANTCTYVQDAYGCTGKSFDVTRDGGELAGLEAEGFIASPEPGTFGLLGIGFVIFTAVRRRFAIAAEASPRG